MSYAFRVLICALAILLLGLLYAEAPAPLNQSKDQWERAAKDVKRLTPSAFKQLPPSIVRQLKKEGCMIPQATHFFPKPHNVIAGEFAQKGQKDWAVLCSKSGKTSLQVFWGKDTPCPNEFPATEDRYSLQGYGDAGIVFSRAIQPVGRKYILGHYKAYGGPEPPPINHEGIDEGFLGKASVVLYCHQGKWMRLQGAD